MTIDEELEEIEKAIEISYSTIRLANAKAQALLGEKCCREGCGATYGYHQGSTCRETGCTGFVRVVLVPCQCCEKSEPCETGPSGGRCCVCCMNTGVVQG